MEERIRLLEERIAKLEKKERRRTIISTIKTVITIIVLAVIVTFGIYAYKKVKETIGPLEKIAEKYNNSNFLGDIESYLEKIK
jgi:hypothetical protein